jgi:hypothetical protein
MITLEGGTILRDAVIRLTPRAVISGEITNQDRDPQSNVTVTAYRVAYVRGQKQPLRASSVQTDDLGNYRIADLTPGSYYLVVQPATTTSGPQPRVTAPEGLKGVDAYLAGWAAGAAMYGSLAQPDKAGMADIGTFYPNGVDIASATPLNLAAGASLEHIDIRVRREPVHSVRGRVIPAEDAVVIATRRDGGIQRASAVAYGGTFELRNLPRGIYRLDVQTVVPPPEAGRNRFVRIQAGRGEAVVGGADVDGVSINIEPGIVLTGSFRSEGGDLGLLSSKTPGLKPVISLVEEDPTIGSPPRRQADAYGKFELPPAQPGRYLIEITGLPDNTYVKNMRYVTGLRVPGQLLEVTRGGGTLDFILSDKAASVGGILRDASGNSLHGDAVSLWPKILPRWNATFGIKSTVTDLNGKFEIGGLAPGEYYVAGWEGEAPNSGVIRIPGLLDRFAGAATAITVSEGSQISAVAKLIPANEIASELARQ